MPTKITGKYYDFSEFKKFKGLIHGISNREFGDCRKNPEKFLKTLTLTKNNLVLAEQVHGNKIRVVGVKDKGQTIDGVDGLITKESGLILGIRTADCLPILFYEPITNIIGICHAGWKGILAKMPQKMIDLLIMKGSLPENIQVAIGPHICPKCYEVDKDRAGRFVREFGSIPRMISKENDKIYLDLEAVAIYQLINSGIVKKNIDISDDCTGCNNTKYFSYRKNNNGAYGEMLSVISLKV